LLRKTQEKTLRTIIYQEKTMEPTKQTPEKQTDEKNSKPTEGMRAYAEALRAEYAVSQNPNTTFAQKPANEMTKNESVAYYLNQ
jgi:hypothetical protein